MIFDLGLALNFFSLGLMAWSNYIYPCNMTDIIIKFVYIKMVDGAIIGKVDF